MKNFKFVKNKYGKELLMDIGTYNDIPNYFFENELHNTDFFEIIFFTKGNGYLELDQHRIKLSDNTIVFISPYQKRKWFVNKSTLKCHFLFFQDSFLSDFFADKLFSYRLQFFFNKQNPLFIKITKELLHQLHAFFNDLQAEIKLLKPDSEHIIRALLYMILIKLNRYYAAFYSISSETNTNITAYLFKQLLQHEVKNNRTISYYTKKIGVSRITLNKSIKNQFGLTASQMIDEYILYEIKSQLLYTTLTINEISNNLHFSEPNHLTRFFKKCIGVSPKEYRNTYQNGRSVF